MNIQNSSITARVSRPQRAQVEMFFFALEQMLPADHRARTVWAFVQGLNLEPLYARIEVTENSPGRSAIAPEVLLALWLLATLDGIGSARELDRRCETDLAYLWLRGNVPVNYHTLSDFRVEHGEFLNQLLVDTLAALVDRGLVPLSTIAQDGMRVKASAGKSSFRRRPTLQNLQKQAQEHVDRLRKETENEAERQTGDARRKAAHERAARERQERIEEALQQAAELSQRREARRKGDGEKTRVSTTDPEARQMKMADGGYDPAFSVQFATDGDTRLIVGVQVTNEGNDGGELPPMLAQVVRDYGKTPQHALVDGAFATKESVTSVEAVGTKIVSSIPRADQMKEHGNDPYAPQYRDTPEYAAFRQRMALPEYQALYKQRPSIAEFPNADCRNRNLRQFRVRGLAKVKAVALWHALAFNFLRFRRLGWLSPAS